MLARFSASVLMLILDFPNSRTRRQISKFRLGSSFIGSLSLEVCWLLVGTHLSLGALPPSSRLVSCMVLTTSSFEPLQVGLYFLYGTDNIASFWALLLLVLPPSSSPLVLYDIGLLPLSGLYPCLAFDPWRAFLIRPSFNVFLHLLEELCERLDIFVLERKNLETLPATGIPAMSHR